MYTLLYVLHNSQVSFIRVSSCLFGSLLFVQAWVTALVSQKYLPYQSGG
jgi:hypothetical protein